jgi:hypothetical protein
MTQPYDLRKNSETLSSGDKAHSNYKHYGGAEAPASEGETRVSRDTPPEDFFLESGLKLACPGKQALAVPFW